MDPKFLQIYSALSVSMVAYACGAVLTYPGVVMAQWERPGSTVTLTSTQASWFASIVQLVSIPGSIISGPLVECIGPKRLTLVLLPVLAITWIFLTLLVHNAVYLIIMRAIQGLVESVLANTAYLYPCEISDVSRRGMLGSFIDTSFSLGFLATYILSGIVHWEHLGYVILCITTVPCFVAVMFVPESPMWLIRKGRIKEAITNLKKVRCQTEDVEKEALLEADRLSKQIDISFYQTLQLLSYPRYLLPVLSSCFLVIVKESSGQFAIVLFVVQIFSQVNTGISAFWCSVIIGITRCICNLVCCMLLSKIPRRNMIIFSTIFAAVAMITMGVYFFNDFLQIESLRWLPLVCVLGFIIFYAMGIGPVTWILAAEILPASVRNLGGGLELGAFNLTQWVVAATFVDIQRSYGTYVPFWGYATGCILMSIFVTRLPETKGKTFAEIEGFWQAKEENWICFSKFMQKFRNSLGIHSQDDNSPKNEMKECSSKLLEAQI